ncbi:hypothetical protein RQP46_001412 [Phenoliferia psychrophenolica]
MLLQDKVVVITGASQGIGAGIALGCARAGAKVVIHAFGDAKTTADAAALEKEIKSLGGEATIVCGDIADSTTSDKIVSKAVEVFGRIDCLVSNAGICPFYAFLDIPHKVWDLTRSVNLDGAFFVVQAVAKQMERQVPQGGSIVAVSSISALVGGGEQCHYTPTKAGVKSLMESCAISLAPYGIRCNSVLPGTIETAINSEDLAQPEKRAFFGGGVSADLGAQTAKDVMLAWYEAHLDWPFPPASRKCAWVVDLDWEYRRYQANGAPGESPAPLVDVRDSQGSATDDLNLNQQQQHHHHHHHAYQRLPDMTHYASTNYHSSHHSPPPHSPVLHAQSTQPSNYPFDFQSMGYVGTSYFHQSISYTFH